MNLIFTCGGTAGHINPAIAVANELREKYPDCKILFIGAEGHMEEKLVPQAGYEVMCLPGSGLSRKLNFAGLKVPDDLFALAHRAQYAFHRMDILFQAREIQLPAQAGAGQAHDLVARLRHQFFLHMAFRADCSEDRRDVLHGIRSTINCLRHLQTVLLK